MSGLRIVSVTDTAVPVAENTHRVSLEVGTGKGEEGKMEGGTGKGEEGQGRGRRERWKEGRGRERRDRKGGGGKDGRRESKEGTQGNTGDIHRLHVQLSTAADTCTRGSSFFLGKVTALGVLCLFLYLTLLASFFLPSHLSLKHVHVRLLAVAMPTICWCTQSNR